MKTTLPKRSLVAKDRLDAIVQEILAVGRKKIAMIILFGSYARGDWVQEEYEMGTYGKGYQSDFDILVLVRKKRYAPHEITNLQCKIEKRLRHKLPVDILKEPPVKLVLEPINRVNDQLEKSRYFFSDIKKEGILLYDSGEYTLAEARELSRDERKQIIVDDYEQWFEQACWFLDDSISDLKKARYKLSAFLLHQATESFYSAILLVFSGYRSKEHDISELGEKARVYHDDLLKIFPFDTQEQEDCFKLLQEAYIRARYDKKYRISEDQLLYLIERVERLKKVTERICLERINTI